MNNGHRWHPIRDYEVDPTTLKQGELAALANVWQEESARLEDSDALPEFNTKLHREWAIETGLIERVYDFDRGVTEVLIEHGIDAALIPHGSGVTPETAASMIRHHEAAIEYVFDFVKDERPLSILSTRKELEHRRDALLEEWNTVKDRAEVLGLIAEERLNEVRATFEKEVKPLLAHVTVFVDRARNHDERSHYFRQQVVAGAKTLEYFANLETYRAWARLVIHNENQSQILVAFHGIGHEFRGVLACCAVFFQRLQTDRNDRETSPANALARTVFQINYREDAASVEDRFRVWLEECIVAGLNDWRTADL